MHPFVTLIESHITDPLLRKAMLEGLFAMHSTGRGGMVPQQNNHRPRVRWFKRNPDGTLGDEEIDARIAVLKNNHTDFGLDRYEDFDEAALREDMKLHPKKYHGPVPLDQMQSIESQRNVVNEMDLPTMAELRQKCYVDTLSAIDVFFRRCRVMNFDIKDALRKILLEDETNPTPFKFNRTYPFPKLDNIEDIRKAWLVEQLAKSNLPFKAVLDKAYKLYDALKKAEEQGPDAVSNFKFNNYLDTYDIEKERQEQKEKAAREAKYNL